MSHLKERKIVEPKDASTVMLLRQRKNAAGDAIELLMVLRHPNNKFVGNAYVYPGGALDEEDCSPEMDAFCRGMDREKAVLVMPDIPARKALGAWVAGIRESFEEVGILLAYDKNGSIITFDEEDKKKRFSAYRDALCGGKGNLKDMLTSEGLVLATDRVHYFSHWITPEPLPIRYDVRFFVAEAPERQDALHDGCELIKHVWITPQEALNAYESGNFGIVLPTIMTLKELCPFKTVGDVIKSAARKNIPKILTKMTRKGNAYVEIMPDGSVFGPSPV
jgi:8-oxo-dGTP pyrophosphatase MutT (NUDIX family)